MSGTKLKIRNACHNNKITMLSLHGGRVANALACNARGTRFIFGGISESQISHRYGLRHRETCDGVCGIAGLVWPVYWLVVTSSPRWPSSYSWLRWPPENVQMNWAGNGSWALRSDLKLLKADELWRVNITVHAQDWTRTLDSKLSRLTTTPQCLQNDLHQKSMPIRTT